MFGIDDAIAIPAAAAVLNFIGGERTNAANAQQAENQMNFQAQMSNTSHQREVADLRAAGLNPILSARYGGSSTPSGASAQMINSMYQATQSGTEVYRAGLEGRRNPSQIAVNESSARNLDQAALLSVEQQDVARATARKIGIESDNIEAGTAKILYELRNVLPSMVELNRASTAERAQMAERIMVEIKSLLPVQSQKMQMEFEHLRATLRGALIEESIDTTAWAGFWRYVGRMFSGTIGQLFSNPFIK